MQFAFGAVSSANGLLTLYRQLTGTQIMSTTRKMWLGLLALITGM